jgi:hypothetical protein
LLRAVLNVVLIAHCAARVSVYPRPDTSFAPASVALGVVVGVRVGLLGGPSEHEIQGQLLAAG